MYNRILLTLTLSILGVFLFGGTILAGSVELSEHRSNPGPTTIKSDMRQYRLLRFQLKADNSESVKISYITARIIRPDNGYNGVSYRDIHNCYIHEGSSGTPISEFPAQPGTDGKIQFSVNKTISKNSTKDFSIFCAVPGKSNARLVRAEVHTTDIVGIGLEDSFNIGVTGNDVIGETHTVEVGEPDLVISEITTDPKELEYLSTRDYYVGKTLTEDEYNDLKVEFTIRIKNQGTIDAYLDKDFEIAIHLGNFGNVIHRHKLTSSRTIDKGKTLDISFDIGPDSGLLSKPGEQRIIAEIDSGNDVPEKDEDNNELEKLFQINKFGELQISDGNSFVDMSEVKTGQLKRLLARFKLIGYDSYDVTFDSLTITFDNCKDSFQNIRIEGGTNGHDSAITDGLSSLATSDHKFMFDPIEAKGSAFYRLSIYADIAKECEEEVRVGLKAVNTRSKVVTPEGFPLYGKPFKVVYGTDLNPPISTDNSANNNEPVDPKDVDGNTSSNTVATSASKVVKIFAFGKPRISLEEEKNKALELKGLLQQAFGREIPIHRDHWYIYVNSFIYGEYPIRAIVQGLKFGGKTVHPVIPYHLWKETDDFKEYITK